ncbi:MAG: diaminopimelate epimerase, partial [Pseudomonadota bacterium]|nr:diaminopimelate epimerase [Pseudomonadota bacterium]
MQLKFTKMHGLGNDFLVLELVTQNFDLTPELIRTWGDR